MPTILQDIVFRLLTLFSSSLSWEKGDEDENDDNMEKKMCVCVVLLCMQPRDMALEEKRHNERERMYMQ